jgi:hypothetical protein
MSVSLNYGKVVRTMGKLSLDYGHNPAIAVTQ